MDSGWNGIREIHAIGTIHRSWFSIWWSLWWYCALFSCLDVAGCHRSIAFAMAKRCRPRCELVAYHTTQSFSASEQLCIWCMSSRFTTGITLQSAISPLVMHRCLQREFTMLLCWMDSVCTCLMCPGGATIEVSIVVALVMRCQSSYGFVYCVCITF